MQRSLQREYNLPSEVVPTGVDTKFFHARMGPRGQLFVREFCLWDRLRPFKQPQMLLEAAVRFPEADFVIAGEGLMADELKARIERERLSNVTLAGLLAAEAVEAAISAGRYFPVSVQWEGSPKVLAGGCGVRPAGDCAK